MSRSSAKHLPHVARLVRADPVLAGDGAAVRRQMRRISPDISSAFFSSSGIAAVEEHQRMQVAVARVEDVGHPQPVLRAQLLDLAQHRASACGDHAVLDDVVRADAARRREGALRPFHISSRSARRCAPNLQGARLPAELDQPAPSCSSHLRPQPIQLHQQRPRRASGQSRVNRRLGRVDGEVSIISMAAGRMPAGDDMRDRLARLVVGGKAASNVRIASGLRTMRSMISVAMPSVPSRADEDAGQVVAGLIERIAAQVRHARHRQHHAHAEHVVDGEAVLEAVRAAGVFGDVAADGADALRGRVGRIVVAVGRDALCDLEVDHAGLRRPHDCVVEVNLEDPPHPREPDDDAAAHRQRAAG